jgi:cholesterol oxidase
LNPRHTKVVHLANAIRIAIHDGAVLMKRISSPFESLIETHQPGKPLLEADYLIIGSGYGGAVAAMRLASDGSAGNTQKRDVVVLERGKEYMLGDFPYDIEDVPAHLHLRRDGHKTQGYSDALVHIHIGSDGTEGSHDKTPPRATADIVVGSGIGGTSLINSNVAEEPLPHVFRKAAWPAEIRELTKPLAAEFAHVRRCIGVTTRVNNADGQFPKYTALRQFGHAIGSTAHPANIAVSTETASNDVGVKQSPCTDCGNCVTGCNVGAKNTLDRNLLRLAKSRGARLFNSATVVRVERSASATHPWRVIVQATVQPVGTISPQTYDILASNVILAAGSLGSTEILLRSQMGSKLQFSDKLGEKFSTNGDGLIMSYGQAQPVRAICGAEQKSPVKRVGPNITGIIRTQSLSIEDASIPASLGRIFSELVTTSAMLQRMENRELPALFDKADYDPLAASMEVAEHCQALLIMGGDRADGQLSLRDGSGELQIAFPHSNICDNEALEESNALVKKQDRKDGLDGGQYAPNPMWELVPAGARGVLGGTLPTGRAIAVHPLGGCAMGDDVTTGVVDHRGRVFNRAGGVHDGLYVLDGAIIPTALEVNPFLTIAALAWRNVGLILAGSPESPVNSVLPEYSDLGAVPDRLRDRPRPTAFVIQEQLTGAMSALTPSFSRLNSADQERLKGKDGLVVQVRSEHPDAENWLKNPGAQPLKASMQLYVNPLPLEMIEDYQPVGVEPAHLHGHDPFMTLEGKFTILPQEQHSTLQDYWGGIKAVITFLKRRGMKAINLPSADAGEGPIEGLHKKLRGICTFFNIGIQQSRFRHLSYAFKDQVSGLTISGDKVLGYSCELKRMWPALLDVTFKFKEEGGQSATADLSVNVEYLLDPGLVQITQSAHLPQSLLFAGSLAAYFARSLFATNFWEFAGLEYPDQAAVRPLPPALEPDNAGPVIPEFHYLDVPVREKSAETLQLLLTHYRRENSKPILLLHGLAQSSQIFWTSGIKNLATYFYENGHDVWLLDYRLSALVLPTLADHDWTMDEIALFDIPAAINEVCKRSGHENIRVFGHCVGACTLAMAVLKDGSLSDKIEAAVTNAIHPWVIFSRGNRFRAKFGSFYREWVSDLVLDPNPVKSETDAVQNMLDRIAYGLARINEQPEDAHRTFRGSELSNSVCDRMSFLYARMWNHKNLASETHEEFLQMMGPSPVRTYQHLYYYADLRRLTDKDGENTYLIRSQIKKNWKFPILFIHGADSRVFNPHSAVRSAMRLQEILTPGHSDLKPAIRFKVFPDFGHMDVVFGKNAHEKCFDEYLTFFNDPLAYKSEKKGDWPEPYEAMPLVGPILRAAWIEEGKICLRLWSELRRNVTTLPRQLIADRGQLGSDFEIDALDLGISPTARFRLLDIKIQDIDAPITLALRGEIPRYWEHSAAELKYDQQAWLLRLRAAISNPQNESLSFVVGSCRFPGSMVDNSYSDVVYEAIARQISTAEGAQLLFLIGDQIYADAMDQIFEIKTPNSRYTERYRRAFGFEDSPKFADLVKQIPTHFALDDHEFDDNWSALPGDATDEQKLFQTYARGSAARYMGSGRNQFPIRNATTPTPFYYPLVHPEECAFPMFLLDTRSEREFRESDLPSKYRLFDDVQYQTLTAWLVAAQANDPSVPKFIVSGSIVAPLPSTYCAQKSTWQQLDGWAGYPRTLEMLLLFIVCNEIENVVFVGGDAHLSSVSTLELTLPATPGSAEQHGVVRQIVSSGLYAPLPFANAHVEDFTWDKKIALPTHLNTGLIIECTNTQLSDSYQQFVRVDADRKQITVTCYDASNQEQKKEILRL